MSTVILSIEEVIRDLRAVVRRIFRSGDNVVITDGGKPVAEIVPARVSQPDLNSADLNPTNPGRAKIVRDELTGLPVIMPPKGTPPLTPEAVRSALSDFP